METKLVKRKLPPSFEKQAQTIAHRAKFYVQNLYTQTQRNTEAEAEARLFLSRLKKTNYPLQRQNKYIYMAVFLSSFVT